MTDSRKVEWWCFLAALGVNIVFLGFLAYMVWTEMEKLPL